MPFVNYEKSGNTGLPKVRHYDFTLIGCGAIGIFLGLELAQTGRSVLILESGDIGERDDRQILNQSVLNRSDLEGSVHWGRKRALGGTTIRWGGQALRFSPIDFSRRKWLNVRDWPFGYFELEDHYVNAERYLNVSSFDYYEEAISRLRLERPTVGENLMYHVSKWAPEPNMFKRYRSQLEQKLTVIYNAHVTNLTTEANSVSEVEIRNHSGAVRGFDVVNLILTNGGLESVRFLMLHADLKTRLLGKGFMEHPCINLGTISTSHLSLLQRQFATHLHRCRKYGIRLSLSEKAQIENKLLNVSASLMFESGDSSFDPYSVAVEALKSRSFGKFLELVRRPIVLWKFASEFLTHGIAWKENPSVRLTAMAEQECLDESQLSLSLTQVDTFNLPKLEVNWNISESTWRAVCFLGHEVKKVLEAFGHSVDLRDEVMNRSFTCDWEALLSPVNHHMGGARIGQSPKSGVVDENLKVFEYSNLFVCSSSVFPSTSHSNPTLTALALASRLKEYLSREQ